MEEVSKGHAPEPNGDGAQGKPKSEPGGGVAAGVAPIGVPTGIGGKAAPGYNA